MTTKSGKGKLGQIQGPRINMKFDVGDLDDIMSIDLTDVIRIAGDVSFDGFDPIITFNLVTAAIKSERSKMASLKTILTFSQLRGFGGGKSWDQIYGRTAEKGVSILKGAVTAFNVKLGKPTSKTDITIPRLIAAFPLLVFKIRGFLLDAGSIVEESDFSGSLPLALRFSGSPAVLDEESWAYSRADYLEYMRYLSDKWNAIQSDEDIAKFAELSYNSKTVPESHRFNTQS
jgi:hypothetical protein